MQPCTIALHDRAQPHDPGHFTRSLSARIVHGMVDAMPAALEHKNWKTMGTELLTVGISVVLFGLCALFVRICNRI